MTSFSGKLKLPGICKVSLESLKPLFFQNYQHLPLVPEYSKSTPPGLLSCWLIATSAVHVS